MSSSDSKSIDQKVLDLKIFEELKEFLGDDDFRRVLNYFKDNIQEVASIKKSSDQLPLLQVRQLAHKLKSSSATLGTMLFHELCQTVENSYLFADGSSVISPEEKKMQRELVDSWFNQADEALKAIHHHLNKNS